MPIAQGVPGEAGIVREESVKIVIPARRASTAIGLEPHMCLPDRERERRPYQPMPKVNKPLSEQTPTFEIPPASRELYGCLRQSGSDFLWV